MNRNIKIGICAAKEMGYVLTRCVLDAPYPIEFCATCSSDTTEYKERIVSLCSENSIHLLEDIDVNSPSFTAYLRESQIDLVLLLWWPSIVKEQAIKAVKIGWVNIHTSLLPFNRGMHPYYWAIVEDTPYGVTIHLIDDGIDSGPILFQQDIPIEITDTGDSLYKRMLDVCVQLFRESYPKLASLEFEAKNQDERLATFHRAAELDFHSHIDLNKDYQARDLINRIRARTFPGRPSTYFRDQGKKYWLRLEIEEAGE